MESLAVYASESDSEGDVPPFRPEADGASPASEQVSAIHQPATPSCAPTRLPPPPDDLLRASASPGWYFYAMDGRPSSLCHRDCVSSRKGYEGLHKDRIRSFPHVDGNYALHVYIPVTVPSHAKNEVLSLMDKAIKLCPGLQSMEDAGTSPPLRDGAGAGTRLQSVERLRICGEYHISLSRTVPIRIHQIESITTTLRHKFSNQKKFIVDFGSWEVFTNDEKTRTFLSLEIIRAGLPEIQRQVSLVDDVFGLHNLPKFYQSPRPHISLAWALGDVTSSLTRVSEELNKCKGNARRVGLNLRADTLLWTSPVKRVECKIGQRTYPVWASA